MKWGYRDWALQLAIRLCNTQNPDGSWGNTGDGTENLIVSTSEILGGLLDVSLIYPEINKHIAAGCDWMFDKMQEIIMPIIYGEVSEGRESIDMKYLYGLLPLMRTSQLYGKEVYGDIVHKIRDYLSANSGETIIYDREKVHDHICLAGILVDIGEKEAAWALLDQSTFRKENKEIPDYNKLYELFQLAIVCYRAGTVEKGNIVYKYACGLLCKEDECGDKMDEMERIRTAQYFLDALYYKIYAMYNNMPYTFLKKIDKDDGRYMLINQFAHADKPLKVLDVGCGTGRYLKNLLEDAPQNIYFAVDFSQQVLDEIKETQITKLWGRHCQLPFGSNEFDYTYTCEALCHAVDAESAVKEMVRVTREGGTIVIVDKNKDNYGCMEIADWEQWYDEKELENIMKNFCIDVQVYNSVSYEGKEDGLFSAWVGVVRKTGTEYPII